MQNPIEPAKLLQVGLECSGARVIFPYQIDKQFSGQLEVTYPFDLDAGAIQLLPPITVGVAVFIGQLCLARRIVLGFPCSAELTEGIRPLAEMLYDVRCWKDHLDLMPTPEWVCAGGDYALSPFTTDGSKHACLLWSGGKDSALSTILLQKNGFTINPVHFNANARVEESEARATASLGTYFGLPYDTVLYDFKQFLEIARSYAVTWDTFPHFNPVPFGRDLVIALLATLVARRHRASYLCLGHELDSRSEYLTYQGKRFARCEIESIDGEAFLEKYIANTISPTMKFLPPVGALSEFRTLYEMYNFYPDLMSRVSFCFWGNACGRCSKCLRYYLVERVLNKEGIVPFQVNPLEGDNCPDLIDYIENWQQDEAGALHGNEVFFCMAKLVERGDIRRGEYLLERFAKEIYPHIHDGMAQAEQHLMQVHRDRQIPDDFRFE